MMTLILTVLSILLFLGFIYKIVSQYKSYFYYKRQGIPVIHEMKPFIGHLYRGMNLNDESKPCQSPLSQMYQKDYPKNDIPLFYFSCAEKPWILVTDAHLIEEIFTKNNKFLTKDTYVKNLMYPLMGESILLSETNELWSNKRKVLSASFYKDKLLKMIELVRHVVGTSIEDWRERFIKRKEKFDLIEEVSLLQVKILLICALGEDISEISLPYSEKGVTREEKIAIILRETFRRQINRVFNP